jgi:pimeloyl-ACP methyl ester carboxylesterase
MRRRDLITLLGGAAAWPVVARSQQGDLVRRIGVLWPTDENDPVYKPRLSAFTQTLADLGWTDGRNVRLDLRQHGGDINRIRAVGQELVGLQPDIIVTNGTPATIALQRETRTIPIVFANVGDPVPSGLVVRLDRPGGNITGFATMEASLGGKWLELLSEIAPRLKRAAIMFNPETTPGSVYVSSFETAARTLKVEEVVIEKPTGEGPFPLLVFNHGSTGNGREPARFGVTSWSPEIADYFVKKGWMVAFPQRRGRGKSDGLYDEGFAPDRAQGYTCDPERSLAGADRALDDIEAAVAALKSDRMSPTIALSLVGNPEAESYRLSTPPPIQRKFAGLLTLWAAG